MNEKINGFCQNSHLDALRKTQAEQLGLSEAASWTEITDAVIKSAKPDEGQKLLEYNQQVVDVEETRKIQARWLGLSEDADWDEITTAILKKTE